MSMRRNGSMSKIGLVILTAFAAILIWKITDAVPVQANNEQEQTQTVSVYINGQKLNTGFYTFSGYAYNGGSMTSSAVSDNDNYIYYDGNGTMTVSGTVKIYADDKSKSNDNDNGNTVLLVQNGTLKLKGDSKSNLTIGDYTDNYNRNTLLMGTDGAAVETDGYGGSITFNKNGGQGIITGLSSIELEVGGLLSFSCDENTKGEAAISAGSISLEAKDLYFRFIDNNGSFSYAFEATDAQNGEIRLALNKQGSNKLELVQGSNINVTDAIFKAKNTYLTSNNGYSGIDGILLIAGTIAEGSLTISPTCNLSIDKVNTVATGDLTIKGTTDTRKIAIEGNSTQSATGQGKLVTGKISIDAENAATVLTTSNGAVASNVKIKAKSLSMSSAGDTVIKGNAEIETSGNIVVSGAGTNPVITGSNISMNATNGDIYIKRIGDDSANTQILGSTLQTQNVMVQYSDKGKLRLVTAIGKTYSADSAETCQHPAINGSTGNCAVCGDPDVYITSINYLNVTGAEDADVKELGGDFGGPRGVNVVSSYLKDGDTVVFTKDVYAHNMDVELKNNSSAYMNLTFDLGNHTLMTKSLSTQKSLTIKNGTYRGTIVNNAADEEGAITLDNVTGTLSNLEWRPVAGVNLTNSRVTVNGNGGTGKCWLEQLTMDQNSNLKLENVTNGIQNSAKVLPEEFLKLTSADASIADYLPKGYELKKSGNVNTIVDADGNIASNIVIGYQKKTDNGSGTSSTGTDDSDSSSSGTNSGSTTAGTSDTSANNVTSTVSTGKNRKTKTDKTETVTEPVKEEAKEEAKEETAGKDDEKIKQETEKTQETEQNQTEEENVKNTVKEAAEILEEDKLKLDGAIDIIKNLDENIQTGSYILSDTDEISFDIPDELKADNRTFYLVTVDADGNVVILQNESTEAEEFEALGEAGTVYQLIFEDGETPLAAFISDAGILETSESNKPIWPWIVLAVVVLGAGAFFLIYKKKNNAANQG